jgi:hypothetical protein
MRRRRRLGMSAAPARTGAGPQAERPLWERDSGLARRRRSRTYQPLGYNGLPVLKISRGGSTKRFERGLRPRPRPRRNYPGV